MGFDDACMKTYPERLLALIDAELDSRKASAALLLHMEKAASLHSENKTQGFSSCCPCISESEIRHMVRFHGGATLQGMPLHGPWGEVQRRPVHSEAS